MTGPGKPKHVTRSPAAMAVVYKQRADAARMRREGHSWDEIAATCGFADKASAYNAVKRLNEQERDLAYEEVTLWRTEQLARYMDVLRVNWPFMKAGSEKHAAIVLRTLTRIDKLTGAEAPIKYDLGEGDVDRALRELDAEINRRAAEAARQAADGEGSPR
jgi:hypothetical protein